MTRTSRAAEEIRQIAADVGVHAGVHAHPLGVSAATDAQVGVDADVPVPLASLYKLTLAGCWSDLVATAELDPLAPLTLEPERRPPGATGVAALADPVTLSLRDTVRLMLTVSDNAAAEAVLEVVGLERVTRWCLDLGLRSTHVRRGSAESLRRVFEEVGGRSLTEALARLADPAADRDTSEYHSVLTTVSTPADLTTLLEHLWSADHHAWVSDSMRLQAWRHRIGSGFPHDDVSIAAKTGTLGRLRHEAAVVHFPGEHPVAVAVMTMSIRPEEHQPRVDAAIGAMARVAVNALRRPTA